MSMNPEEQMLLMLGEIRGELKGLNGKMDSSMKLISETVRRVDSLDNWRSNLMGKITVLTAVIGSASAYFIRKILG